MHKNVITYNLFHAKDLYSQGGVDAVAMYYLFKILFPNSIIYNPSEKELYHRLKQAKIISQNFKYKRFTEALDCLIKNEYIKLDEKTNHFVLKNIHTGKKFYKSKILYTKSTVTWNCVVEAVVKEELKYTKFRQEKAIDLRDKVTKSKKSYKLFKKLYKNGLYKKYYGESFAEGVLFTYRGIAAKTGLSVRTIHKHIKNLVNQSQVKIITVKEVGDTLPCSLDYIKDSIPCYCYVDRYNRLVKVIGSRLLDISIS